MITVSALNGMDAVRHAFFTRAEGYSEGIYHSLNCGYGTRDAPERVTRNRARAMELLEQPADALVTVQQRHTADVVRVDRAWSWQDSPVADAMVTDQPGLAIGVLVADCAPVLFADQTAGVVGAAHAGWRGALTGVLENTVDAMEQMGARRDRITAVVGPCITQRSYEVGPEFVDRFVETDAGNQRFFAPGSAPHKAMFDLPGYIGARLQKADVQKVVRTPCDTVQEDDRFFSYRRSVLNREPDYGRMLAAIVLE